MSQTTEQTAARPADAPVGRSVSLPCPHCGQPAASVTVNLALLGDDTSDVFQCLECNTEFSVESVKTLVDKWTKLLAWLDAVPAMGE